MLDRCKHSRQELSSYSLGNIVLIKRRSLPTALEVVGSRLVVSQLLGPGQTRLIPELHLITKTETPVENLSM